MLQIEVPETEYFDESTSTFGKIPRKVLHLEHSLLSISKWESKWHKPYLGSPNIKPEKQQKTDEEIFDYIRCMSIDKDVDPNTFRFIPPKEVDRIREYINDPMTATWFSNRPDQKRGSREIVTSEVIYYWMIALNIPFECQKWHLNRLLTLIRVCNLKQQPPKKMSKSAISKQNAAINAARRSRMGTKG